MLKLTTSGRTGILDIVGEGKAASDPQTCASFAVDTVEPQSVVYGETAEDVCDVLKLCFGNGLSVVPWGNGSKMGIGATPRQYHAALCLNRMKRVTYYEPDDLVISVEAGARFSEVQTMLQHRGLWIPLDPVAADRATVGGILAANSAGPLRLRYGSPRDMVLGMTIATADGSVVKTGGRVVKNVAGYDLAKLMIGSLGTLGVIVEATFKLHPRVRERATWLVEIGTSAGARELRRSLLASPLRPLRAVLLNGRARALIGGAVGAALADDAGEPVEVIEAGGSERVLARYGTELGTLAAKAGANLRRVEPGAAERVWLRCADFGNALPGELQSPVVLKATVPLAAAEEFLERAEQAALAENREMAGMAQLGVGVVELAWPSATEPGRQDIGPTDGVRIPSPGPQVSEDELIERLRQCAHGLGGRLVVTRCPARLKSKVDVWGPPGDDFEVMRKLKAAWDPNGVLAPGRFAVDAK